MLRIRYLLLLFNLSAFIVERNVILASNSNADNSIALADIAEC